MHSAPIGFQSYVCVGGIYEFSKLLPRRNQMSNLSVKLRGFRLKDCITQWPLEIVDGNRTYALVILFWIQNYWYMN